MPGIRRRQFLSVLAGGATALGGASLWWTQARHPGNRNSDQTDVRRATWALGTHVSITALHVDTQQAEQAIDAAFAELELVEQLMSIYRSHSQLSQLNRDGVLEHAHPHLLQVLSAAQTMSDRTGGAFDVTIQPLWQLYAASQAAGRLPTEDEIAMAQRVVDWRNVVLEGNRVHLRQPDMAVTLNGVAQGFATDRVGAVLRDHGIEHALIDTGELGTVGTKLDGQGWNVGIQHPRDANGFLAVAKLAGRCLATSGDYATTFSPDYRHHHIFDPRTGRSPTELMSVSVVAATGLEADALSTAIFVLGAEAGLRLVQETPQADALLVLKNGRQFITPGFPV